MGQMTLMFLVLCAVYIATSRQTVLMVPARTNYPTSWTTEYNREWTLHLSANHECMDRSLEFIPGSDEHNTNGALFYNQCCEAVMFTITHAQSSISLR